MPMADHDFNNMKTDVEILKKDVSNIQGLLNRLDTAIDKIADATGGISQILAVHEQNISSLRDDDKEGKRVAEKQNELVHQRISDMKDESSKHHKDNHSAVMAKLDKMDTEVSTELKNLSGRVTMLERWKWWVMGGSWAIGLIIATIVQMSSILQSLGG